MLAKVELPSVPVSADTMTTAGLVMAGLVLVVTLVPRSPAAPSAGLPARVDKAGW